MIKTKVYTIVIVSLMAILIIVSICDANQNNVEFTGITLSSQLMATSAVPDSVEYSDELVLLRVVTEKIHPSLPEFTFKLYGQNRE